MSGMACMMVAQSQLKATLNFPLRSTLCSVPCRSLNVMIAITDFPSVAKEFDEYTNDFPPFE